MRVILQCVSSGRVIVDSRVVGDLRPAVGEQGLVALVGVTHSDTAATARSLADKMWTLRILDGERSAADCGAPVLVISQFTLYGDARKGRRPSWNAAAKGDLAEPLIDELIERLRELGARVETGIFGAHMQVELVNDGPVTVVLEA